jgi:hypothetical protein
MYYLWETVSMPKRKLRIVKSIGETALTGVCEYCNQTFSSPAHIVGPASKIDIETKFEAHTCKRLDASQNAVRIARETTE